jgi:hypothetical protein
VLCRGEQYLRLLPETLKSHLTMKGIVECNCDEVLFRIGCLRLEHSMTKRVSPAVKVCAVCQGS